MTYEASGGANNFTIHSASTTFSANAICPDLLDHSKIGAADNLRGRVVRAFFWLMRAWPT